MGLLVDVFVNKYGVDCTNKGISSGVKTLCVVNVDGPFEPREDTPAVMLVNNHYNTVRIVPAVKLKSGWDSTDTHTMFGGNYAATSDGRFIEKIEELTGNYFYGAVPIHDRIE